MKLLRAFVSITGCLLVGFAGSIVTMPQIGGWYMELNKPWFNPPNWIFGPVWTTLYILMGLAWFLVWNKGKKKDVREVGKWFGLQLGLNLLWSVVFFGFNSPDWALLVIILLWWSILMTIQQMMKVSILASKLMTPYLLWVSFASLLNFEIVRLN